MIEMNKSYIEDNHIVQRYIHGNLTAEELAEFEKYMLLHPEVMEEIELAHTFKRGLELYQNASSENSDSKRSKLLQWIWPTGGFAAGALATWLLVSPVAVLTSVQTNNSPDIIYVEAVRSGDGMMESFVNQDSVSQILVFDVSAGFEPRNRYDVTLYGNDEQVLNAWPGLKANQQGELVLQANLTAKPGQTHKLKVQLNGDTVLETRLIYANAN